MPVSKATEFDALSCQLAVWAKALGHPARIVILRELALRNECVCGEIVDELPLAQSTVSQHLKALLEAGLIQGRIDGPRSCYCINRETMRHFKKVLEDFLNIPESKTCC